MIPKDAGAMQKHANKFDVILNTLAASHNIVSDIETIPIQKIDEAYERMLKSDVKYRFVIDMASLR
ncbi:MAG TPA: hypothetical protein VG733_11030 [Chthoniobacteraceae bacterium]|nr:hypothetical protein [Chthoniobacteraceae bacterium]